MLGRFLLAVTVGRAAVFALPLGLFFAAAAAPANAPALLATASALTLGSGLGLWPVGRLLDRIGPWRGLRRCLLAGAASLAVLAVAVGRGWPLPGVLVIAVMSGVSWSAVIATPRALLPDLAARHRLPWASGVEAACVEVALMFAPVVGAVLGDWGPATVPAVAAGLLVAAALLLPAPAGRGRQRVSAQPLVSRHVLALSALALLLGLSGGLMEPGLAALPAASFGGLAGNAVLFVALGLGSAAGGLLAARTGWPHHARHSVALLVLHAVALGGATTLGGPLRLGLLLIAGLPIAPLQSLAALHLDHVAGPGRASETFGVVTTALTLGTALGQAVAAHATTHLAPTALTLLATAPPLAAAALIAARRHRSGAAPNVASVSPSAWRNAR